MSYSQGTRNVMDFSSRYLCPIDDVINVTGTWTVSVCGYVSFLPGTMSSPTAPRMRPPAIWEVPTSMKTVNVHRARKGFKVLQTLKKSQSAVMTLRPGQWSGAMGNEHPGSEQTLLVLEGEVVAEIGDERKVLRKGDVVIVPLKAPHRFGNESDSAAITFNVYAPPAY